MKNVVAFLGVMASLTAASPVASQTKIVTCTATRGYHCTSANGCQEDATYVTVYRVDLQDETVTELTVQHRTRDPQPRPGRTVYRIVGSIAPAAGTGETAFIAVTQLGSAAIETVVLGEKTYLSSSVSAAGARIFSMVGLCTGL